MHVIELIHDSAGGDGDSADVQIFVGKFNHCCVNISAVFNVKTST